MKKKIVSAILAGLFVATSVAQTVSAVPQVSEDVKNEFKQKQEKYNELVEKVQVLDNEISELVVKINDNNQQVDNINSEVENVNKEIEQIKVNIEDQEQILGTRLREIYKTGGQASYISILFSADSFSDLISKIDNAKTLIDLDRKAVSELNDSKSELDKKVNTLEEKAKEIESLNAEIKEEKQKTDAKKADQEAILQQAKQEKENFERENIIPIETEAVTPWIQQATNSNSSIDEISSAISLLEAYKNQLQSKEVINKVDDAIAKAKALKQQKVAQQNASTNRGSTVDTGVTVSQDATKLIQYAQRFLGIPYLWGGTTPSGFDCSGFTSYVYRNAAGINIGRTTYDQVNAGRQVSREQLREGDLVFPHKGHVGIYVGNGQMIHAPQTGDVIKISKVNRFYKGIRVLN